MTSTDALALELSGYVPVFSFSFPPPPGRFHPRVGNRSRVFPTQIEAWDYETGWTARDLNPETGYPIEASPAMLLGWADRNQRSK